MPGLRHMNRCALRSVVLVVALLTLPLLAAACGGGKGSSTTAASTGAAGSSTTYPELRWGVQSFAGRLNYYDNYSASSEESLVAQTLVEMEPNGFIKKDGYLASNEQTNPTTYVYHLKSGIKFSDGKPLTTADVVFSLKQHWLGKESGWTPYWTDVSSISASNGATVVVKLKRPEAVWQQVMSFNSQIIEKAQAERAGEKELGAPGHMLIGTGPWRFASYTPETRIVLLSNPYWTGPARPTSKITISLFKNETSLSLALRSGAIDGTWGYLTPKVFANIPSTKQLIAPGVSVTTFAMNTKQPPFNDVHVRRAIAYATNAQGIIKALFPSGDAEEDVSIVPRTLFTDLGSASQQSEVISKLPQYNYDLAAARRELAKSAYPHGFTTAIEANNGQTNLGLIAQVLSSSLAKIGITAKIDEYPPSSEPEYVGSKVKIFIFEDFPGYVDPEGMMQFLLFPNPSPQVLANAAYYTNNEVLRLMKENIENDNPVTRLHLIGKALTIVGEATPYRPLYTHKTFGTLAERYVFPTFSNWTMWFLPWALDVRLAR